MGKDMASIGISRRAKEKFDELHKYLKFNSADETLIYLIDSNIKTLEMVEAEKQKKLKNDFMDWAVSHPTGSYNDFLNERLRR